ncbi:hypothetical protein ABZ027_02620 [Streptomyces sp. NPDC006332]|uniref:hypothetical protein n=1 Tax=Streptomyces sp. NPDC006332 TaxID=3155456 RepID=UPI0033BB59AF
MLGLDIQGSSRPSRDDSVLPTLRAAQTRLIAEALGQQGVDQDSYALRSRGDGGRYDFRPGVSPVPVVEAVTGRLPGLLRRHNKQSSEALQLVLRLVVHGGYLVPTPDGGDADGADVNLLHGMLDAERLRSELVENGAPYVLAVSESIWYGAVRHGHGELDPDAFTPGELTVKGGLKVATWLTPAARTSRPAPKPEPSQTRQADQAPSRDGGASASSDERPWPGITFNGQVRAKNVVSGKQWNIR